MVAESVAAGGYQLNTTLAASPPEAISGKFTFIVTIPAYGGEAVISKIGISSLPLVPDADIQKLL